jgi:hypothetical protein
MKLESVYSLMQYTNIPTAKNRKNKIQIVESLLYQISNKLCGRVHEKNRKFYL